MALIFRRAPIINSVPSTSRCSRATRRWSNFSKRTEPRSSVSGGVDQAISQLHEAALAALGSASTLEAVEAVRVEFLGRKGKIAGVSMGKVAPEERAQVGKLLNSTK